MLHLFNIVGTRVPRGDFDEARRWYVDHVHLLFGHEGMLGARLWQRVPGAAEVGAVAEVPDMLCFYDFGDHDSFAAYDGGALRAEVERDRQDSWGRDGIEVCLRARFRRLYERRAGIGAAAARSRIAATAAGVAPGWERALAAQAHEQGVHRLEIYRAESGEGDVGGGLWMADADISRPPPRATPPGPTSPGWQGVYLPLEQWTR